MYELHLTTKRRAYEPISFGCILISVIFFLVLSQFIFSFIPDIVSQAFRPVIVITLIIMVEKRKIALHEPAHTISLAAAFYCGFVLLLHNIDSEVFISGMNTVMYLLMFYTATKVYWNRRENTSDHFFGICRHIYMYRHPAGEQPCAGFFCC